MDLDSASSRVRLRIAQMASVPESQVSPGSTLRGDLHLDSLQLYELVAELEDELGLSEIDEADVASIETVGDVESCVARLLSPTSAVRR
jgi:acyl carrier protein